MGREKHKKEEEDREKIKDGENDYSRPCQDIGISHFERITKLPAGGGSR